MILTIDTSDKQTRVSLLKDDLSLISEKECKLNGSLSECLLAEIDKILKGADAEKSDISSIYVHRGPGSYTGLRIGVTIANCIAFSLDIPVFWFDSEHPIGSMDECRTEKSGKSKFTSPVVPYYKNEPHITKPSIAFPR